MTQRRVWIVAVVLTLAMVTAGSMVTAIVRAQGGSQSADKWLHVSVVSREANGETVRVNVPLSLAEKVLPAINKDKLHAGRVRCSELKVEGVDLRAVLDAVKNTKDGEFVIVESTKENVRVAKENGYLVVKVREMKEPRKAEKPDEKPAGPMEERVDVRVPMTVVEALLSGAKDELDLVAAIRALSAHGDSILVTVEDRQNTVKIWVDSKNAGQ
ncbi:MAG: hypothetical protein HY234_11355 [Acidobacteria bacterium]|nr:hypothetical protein [Acidobacteriota bacterium]MBI3663629.1 hypothetical protein [Acidobacteriota bacterium]